MSTRNRRARTEVRRRLVRTLGYASATGEAGIELQRAEIASACEELGLELVTLVTDVGPNGDRPGLWDALERIDAGEAACLIVSDLERLGARVADLAAVLDRIDHSKARLVALDVGLDTATPSGRLALAPSAVPLRPDLADEPEAAPDEPAAAEPEPAPAVAAAEAALAIVGAPPAEPPVERPVFLEPVSAGADRPVADEGRRQRAAVLALGYASVPAEGQVPQSLDEQKLMIERQAERLGIELVEVVREREPKTGRALDRAGLSYLISRIAAGDATCVVVSALDRLSRSVAELGTIVQWLQRNDVRLIASDIELDTASPGGRTTALALASVAKWEHERVSERTRSGLAAARAKRRAAAGPDWTEVRERIARMRADGMTLQAIADVLNAEGVPTQRGGMEWRPSSVQTAAGYKRRTRSRKLEDLPNVSGQQPAPTPDADRKSAP